MDKEKYVKGIEKALQKIAVRELKTVDISEIWIETALPKDLIIEILKEEKLNIPSDIETIKDGRDIIWKRSGS
ncbi:MULTISPECIES: hypothetical protein [unclassified Thermotoga]|uniref:hypothetical protein n=1 Tax=unclassified Thermotoga TaxID=2631113 RepID=UPI0005420D8B|nr:MULTISPECIES: hypothetical protein [unclassified Thermotoga]KAF2959231.1 hypothetical protein AS158_06515 [Thermotoga sp. 38H-to]KHC92873.1 hypothetical protein Mc24_01938 [Thermotoga sp. Mc24]